MRRRSRTSGISVHAIAGTHAVLLAMDATKTARRNLLGFAIHRTDHEEDEAYWLKGFRTFEETEPHLAPGDLKSTLEHPIQSFLWGDYTAKPDHTYTYRIRPVRGHPKKLTYGKDVVVRVTTESQDQGTHAVYFNRGAIASQAFATKFGSRAPVDLEDPTSTDVKWLSRGLLEGALEFIAQARSSRYSLRAAVYEFSYAPILEAFRAAAGRGASVKIVYEAGKEKKNGRLVETSTARANKKAVREGRIVRLMKPRTKRKAIPHNKFIVLLDRGKPVQVWTGSTNFTASGFLGQSNVGHVVRNERVARFFLDYWEKLARDEEWNPLRTWNTEHTPIPGETIPLYRPRMFFSPRPKSTMLDWYAERLGDATETVMFTAAFGVNKKLAEKFAQQRNYLRFILAEKPPKAANLEVLRADRDTQIAWGAALGRDAQRHRIPGWELDRWYASEEHFRRQGHVFYVHTKYMLVDPLTDDPEIFTGSANFSVNSLLRNDENMLLIRGTRSVADVYLTEFVRLFNHFYFRDVANRLAQRGQSDARKAVYLTSDDSWVRQYFRANSVKSKRRELFA